MHPKSKAVFDNAKRDSRGVLIGYITAGFPNLNRCAEILKSLSESGVDLIEIGIPYSDPVMDGPVIQQASEISLSGGFRTEEIFELISKIPIPTYVMSYWNPIERYGVAEFLKNLKAAGGVGVITPDLTIEESEEWVFLTDKEEIDRTYVVAPSSSDLRLDQVSRACSGFVYAASLMGVTGAREVLSGEARNLVTRLRHHTNSPIAVGLGVSNAHQAREICEYADGVIVGSAFIKAAMSAPDSSVAAAVGKLATELASGVRVKV